MVDEPVGEGHEVMSPTQQQGQHACCEKCPLERILVRNDEQTQDEEHAHQSTEIDRTARAWLFAPILREGTIDAHLIQLPICLLHGCLIHGERHTCPTLHIGDEEGERLVDAVTPSSDVAAFQTTICLIFRLALLHEFALATHGVLRVFVSVIEVGSVETDGKNSCQCHSCCRFSESSQLLPLDGLYEECHHHQDFDGEEVVGHLHVVCLNLQRGEDGCHNCAQQVFLPIAQNNARNGGRYVCQCHHLPNVTCSDDDEKVAAECPHHGSQCCHPMTEIEGTEQDVET